MCYVKITRGAYGHRPKGSRLTVAKTTADAPFEVPDEEAARLVGLGVAKYAEAPVKEAKKAAAEEVEKPPGVPKEKPAY